eukprot:144351-Prymnesium_polylepis.1
MPATAAAAAAAAAAAGACATRRPVARARRPCAVWVHVRSCARMWRSEPQGTAQPSSLSACRLPAGPISSVLCSIRHG